MTGISREEALRALARDDAEVAQRLRASVEGVAAAEAALADARAVRAAVINEAIDKDWSHSRIAAELGVSKQRVAQLRKESPTNGSND